MDDACDLDAAGREAGDERVVVFAHFRAYGVRILIRVIAVASTNGDAALAARARSLDDPFRHAGVVVEHEPSTVVSRERLARLDRAGDSLPRRNVEPVGDVGLRRQRVGHPV